MRALLGAVIAVAFALATCTSISTSTCPPNGVNDAKKSEAALGDLVVQMYRHVSSTNQDKNTIMSPVSVALALALLESGAAGRTRDSIRKVLTGSDTSSDVLSSYQALQNQLSINDEKVKLSIANGIFPQKDFVLKPDYVTTVESCFGSEIGTVDFAGHLEQSRQKINQWVSNKTASKIPELFKPGVLSPDVAMVLANAIYFKAMWINSFNPTDTKPGPFHRFGREQETQTVQFMSQIGRFGYISDNKMEVLEIDYAGRDFAMYILLPKAIDGLPALERDLTSDKLKSIVIQADEHPSFLKVNMPKFTIRTSLNLVDMLTQLDLGILFSDRADFGRMTDASLKVSKAIHEAYINVNENGTEAAAATGFSIKFRSSPPRDPPEFIINHPFMYAIKHKPTGAFIFLGKVNYIENQSPN